MNREVRLFLNAVLFLTRLPVRSAATLNDDWLFRTAKYFPAVGLLVGAISALAFFCASIIWSGGVPAILAIAVSLLLTGAFHEDGLADTLDGLGGGHTVESRLEIMKDSRLGTYGAIALVLSLTIRIAVLSSLPILVGIVALVAANSMGRFPPLLALRIMRHAGDPLTAKTSYDGPVIRPVEILQGLIFAVVGLVPLAIISLPAAIVGLAGGALLAFYVARKAIQLSNGYTGDVLGAIEQMFEIGFLLGLLAIFS